MAERLEHYTFRSRGMAKYQDWDTWFNGQTWKLIKGVDFTCATRSFQSMAFNEAAKRQKKIRANVEGDSVVIQAY